MPLVVVNEGFTPLQGFRAGSHGLIASPPLLNPP